MSSGWFYSLVRKEISEASTEEDPDSRFVVYRRNKICTGSF
jgi:hypothetical protein